MFIGDCVLLLIVLSWSSSLLKFGFWRLWVFVLVYVACFLVFVACVVCCLVYSCILVLVVFSCYCLLLFGGFIVGLCIGF